MKATPGPMEVALALMRQCDQSHNNSLSLTELAAGSLSRCVFFEVLKQHACFMSFVVGVPQQRDGALRRLADQRAVGP